uniref:Uncharacterized protein n=1 Tax=Timema shepardi TaxID=629360 RepID=A0A7R9G0U0_TIMSH|nr:unnamed protein product [Timema shepardi]
MPRCCCGVEPCHGESTGAEARCVSFWAVDPSTPICWVYQSSPHTISVEFDGATTLNSCCSQSHHPEEILPDPPPSRKALLRAALTEYGDSVCDTLIDQDLEVALKVIEEDGQEVDPDSVAYVKFTPSVGNPHAEFADEVYFPPLVDDEIDPNLVVGLRVRDGNKGAEDYQFPESLLTKKSYTEQYQRNLPMDAESLLLGRLFGSPQVFNTFYNTPDEFRAGIETRDVDEEDQYEQAEDTKQKVTLNRHLNFVEDPRMGDGDDQQTPPQSSRHHGTPVGSRTGDGNDRMTSQSGPHYNTPDGFRAGQETREEERGDNERVDLTFSQDYNTPDRFRQGQESRDDVVFLDQDLREELLRFAGDDDNEIPGNLGEFPVKERFTEGFQAQGSSRIKVPTRHLSPEVQQLASIFHDSKNTYQHQPSKGTGYTEGGLVFLPEHRTSEPMLEPASNNHQAWFTPHSKGVGNIPLG